MRWDNARVYNKWCSMSSMSCQAGGAGDNPATQTLVVAPHSDNLAICNGMSRLYKVDPNAVKVSRYHQ
jgi:hypothetical protein